MGWFDNVRNWFSRSPSQQQPTTTITTQPAQKTGVIVTDFTTGESVKTTTNTTTNTVNRTYSPAPTYGGGGGYNTEPIGQQAALNTVQNESIIASDKAMSTNTPVSEGNTLKPSSNGLQVQEPSLWQKITGGWFGARDLGMPLVTQEQAANIKGNTLKPYWDVTAPDLTEATYEGIAAAETPISTKGFSSRGQFEYNTQNIQIAKDKLNIERGIRLDTQNVIQQFSSNPSSFLGQEGVLGKSTVEGIEITLTSDYFKNRPAFQKAQAWNNNIDVTGQLKPVVAKQYILNAKNEYWSLNPQERMKGTLGEIGYAGAKLGVGTVEFGGSLARTILYNINPQIKNASDVKWFNWKSWNLKGAEGINAVPATPSSYNTWGEAVRHPVGYTSEIVLERPAVSFPVGALAGTTAVTIAKGYGLYASERAAGATRLGALNTVGGEAVSSLAPIHVETGITGVTFNRGKPVQINSGDTLTSGKIGTANDNPIYKQLGQGKYYTSSTLEYTRIKPKLFGQWDVSRESLPIRTFQIVTLKDNMLRVTPREDSRLLDVYSKGVRTVYTFTEEPIKMSNYELGTRGVIQKSTQSFEGYGKALAIEANNKVYGIGKSDFTFKNLERYTYKTGYETYSKNNVAPTYTREGRPFGKGISGRPYTAKGVDINIKLAEVTTPEGKLDYGKSWSFVKTQGVKTNLYFQTETYTPFKNYIEASYTPKGAGGNPKWMDVKNVYSSGEFDYLKTPVQSQITKQITEQAVKTSLAPSSPSNNIPNQIITKNSYTTVIPSYVSPSLSATDLGISYNTHSVTSVAAIETTIQIPKPVTPNSYTPAITSIEGVSGTTALTPIQIQPVNEGSKLITTPIVTSPLTGGLIAAPITSNLYDGGGGYAGGFNLDSMAGLELPSNVIRGGRKKTKYFPSFTALAFKIKGNYKPSNLSKSGLDFRPILSNVKLKRGKK